MMQNHICLIVIKSIELVSTW